MEAFKALTSKRDAPGSGAKVDLLLRLFESEWFNEWMCLQYLYQNPTPGVEDYLCNKLHGMPESAIERFLMEFVYLAVSKPGSALERTIVALCSKSFPVALKVHWFLLALCQDQQERKEKLSKHLDQLKDRCERAALEGQWDVPFRVTKLDPLSPTLSPEASGLMSPILSPLMQAPINLVMASSPNHSSNATHSHIPLLPPPPYHTTVMIAAPGILTQIDESAEHTAVASPVAGSAPAPAPSQPSGMPNSATSCMTIPPSADLSIHVSNSNHHVGARAQQAAPAGRKQQALAEHMERIRLELGEGEGVTALLHRSVGGAVAVVEDEGMLSDDDVAGGLPSAATPLSPVTRLRHDTYGATRDFVDALCDASFTLASISQDERQRALRHTLEAINRELDKTVRRDIAVWFPMGKRNERVVRITAKEAVLLNSREKAPFMLFMEVLVTDDGPSPATATPWANNLASCTVVTAPLQPNLPALPQQPLHSVQGTLTALSPYLTSLVAGTPAAPLPPPGTDAPTPVQEGAPRQQQGHSGTTDDAAGSVSTTTGASPTASGSESLAAGTITGTNGSSQVPSTATSSGLTCSTPESVATARSLANTPTQAAAAATKALPTHAAVAAAAGVASPGPTTTPASPDGDAAAAVVALVQPALSPPPHVAAEEQDPATAITRSMAAPFAAAIEAIGTMFRSGNSRNESTSNALLPPDLPAATAPQQQQQMAGPGLLDAVLGAMAQGSGGIGAGAGSGSAATHMPGGGSSGGGAVVIPHRRRQTFESDAGQPAAAAAVLKATQSVSGGGGSTGGLVGVASAADMVALEALEAPQLAALAPAPRVPPSGQQGGAGGEGHEPTTHLGGGLMASASHEGLPSLTPAPSPSPRQPQQLSPFISQNSLHPHPPALPPPPTAVQPAEQSSWASAISTLTRVLLPSSSAAGSMPPTSPPPGTQSSAPSAGASAANPGASPGTSPNPPSTAIAASSFSAAPAAVLLTALPALVPTDGQPQHNHHAHPHHVGLQLDASQMRRLLSAPEVTGQRAVSPLSPQELEELVQSGALSAPLALRMALASTAPGTGTGGQLTFGHKMAGALASLRGDAPLVKVHIRVLPAAAEFEAAVATAAARRAAAAALPPLHILSASSAISAAPHVPPQQQQQQLARPSLSGGSGDSSSEQPPASFGGTPTAAAGTGAPLSGASSSAAPSTPSSLLTSSSAKALNLLSKIGLCARPAADGDDDELLALGTGGNWLDGGYAGPKMVSVQLEVASGVNLAIISPYRKSRRMPSHEAISMVATQLKISEIPPPLELGPPLASPPSGDDGIMGGGGGGGGGEGLLPAQASTASMAAAAMPSGGGSSSALTDEHAVHASVASFSSLATPAAHAAASQPHGPGHERLPQHHSGGGAMGGSGNSGGLSFPQAAHVADPPSPRVLLPPPPRPESGGSGRLPMVGNSTVVSAAAAAAGELSPVATATNEVLPSLSLGAPLALAAKTSPQAAVVQEAAGGGARQQAELSLAYLPDSVAAAQKVAGKLPQSQQPQAPSGVKQEQLQEQAQQQPGHATGRAKGGAAGPPPPINVDLAQSKRDADMAAAAAAAQLQGLGLAGSAARGWRQPAAHGKTGGGEGGAGSQQPQPFPPPCSIKLDVAADKKRKEAWAVYGERWAARARRIQRESPHGPRKGWALRCVIVKSGDDCRQEVLALQLIRTFGEIFFEASLPLFVRPYEVLVTSNKTAMIEVVPDALSIHTVKHRSPAGSSLSDHFFAKWPKGSPECQVAQRKFTESLAAYSIICYLMQIKDRHNGNVLLDDEGHLVHIDFGFMLSNSPGGVNFESAPFKLTRELLEVMGSNSEGKPSELFDYFKVLMIQGFLACRKHSDRILLLVRMMAKSGLPCFKTGERAVKALEKRLSLGLTEVQAMKEVLALISDSLDAWRTRQYDYYQRLLNGIL